MVLLSAEEFLFYAGAVYYLTNRREPFPKLKESLTHAGVGTGLGFIAVAICIFLTPAFYYHATRFTNPKLMEWVLAFGFFLSLAALEEIIYRGVLQNFFLLFLRPPMATVLQVALFVAVHSFPATTIGIIWRVASLAVFGVFATLLAKKSPYLILPIFYHTSENLFRGLIRGMEEHHLPVEAAWNLGMVLNHEYATVVALIFIFGFWYFYGWTGTGRKNAGSVAVAEGRHCGATDGAARPGG
jgi:membrane protease YdiL (CAAX protease family)